MSDTSAVQKDPLQVQSSENSHTLMPLRQPYMSESFASKRVFFYKSGDAQFNGLPVVISKRTFKTFEGLLDSLSKRVPLPFGVRTITTPRGHTAIQTLDQLHHGHSYICSDKRTVKPIDLEQARRKPPPWYHARPVSRRRVASTRQSHGTHSTRWKEHAALLHIPKRMTVFRNGDPKVKHTLLLHTRKTQSFDELIKRISEVMRFPVHKLYTPDGRRVDGLPALILCSGVLIAAGRETFRKGNYDVRKRSAPNWLPAKNMRMVNQLTQKKKSLTSSTKSRPFSPFSERYIVNQIHDSFSENDPTDSIEMESRQQQETIAKVNTTPCMDGDTQENIYMPTEEDIEKSFRVNKDGSMTVEMKVRLLVKDEETVNWTTTLSRSSVVSHMKSVLESHPDIGAHLPDKIPTECDPVALTRDDVSKESLQKMYKEVDKSRADLIKPLQSLSSTFGQCKVEDKQISVGSTITKAETDSNDNVLGSYTSKEEEHVKLKHFTVRQHPVPKPRSTLPPQLSISKLQENSYKSAEILHIQGRREESVHHTFEQHAGQKSLTPRTQLCGQAVRSPCLDNDQPALTNTVFPAFSEMFLTSINYLYPESKSSAIYGPHRREDKFKLFDVQNSCKGSTANEIRAKKLESPKSSATRMISTNGISKKRKPGRVILKKRHRCHYTTSKHNKKEKKTNILNEIQKIRADIFSQADVMKAMTKYYQSKFVQKLLKRKTNLANDHKRVSAMLPNTVQLKIQSTDKLLGEKKTISKKSLDHANMYRENLKESSISVGENQLYISNNRCSLKRQTSVQEENEFHQDRQVLSKSTSLSNLCYSSSVLDENMKLWLQESKPVFYQTDALLPKSQSFSHVPERACKIMSTGQALNGDLKCFVSQDSICSPRNVSLTYPAIEETSFPMTETVIKDSFPEINVFSIDCTRHNLSLPKNKSLQKETLLDKFSDESQPPNKTTAERLLPRNCSLKNYPWEKCVEHKLSQTENSSENKIIQHVFQDMKLLPTNESLKKKGSTSQAISDSKLATVKSLEPELSSNQEKIGNYHVKWTPLTRNPSSEKILPSQHSIEKIPKNNTLAKASLFKNNIVDKSRIFNKKLEVMHSDMFNGSKSAKTLKFQTKSDLIQTNENLQSVNTQEDLGNVDIEVSDLQEENLYTVKMAVRPDMRHVLDELCYSIKSLREVTQHKQQSCLKKSKSMPDLSSHLASTFGSSSRLFLAFLTVMTLKDGLENINIHHQAKNYLSCSEALLMIKSLEEIAAIEDAEQIRANLNALHNATSNQLLQSWRSFQEVSNRSVSQSVIPECIRNRTSSRPNSVEVIQGFMEKLGVPDRVREELFAFHTQECISDDHIDDKKMCPFPDSLLKEEINVYVKSIIERAVHLHLEERGNSAVSSVFSLVRAKNQIQERTEEGERNFCPMLTTEQNGSVLDHGNCGDISFCRSILEDNQHRVRVRAKERVIEELLHEGGLQLTAKPQETIKEGKGRAICKKIALIPRRISEKGSVEEDYAVEAPHGINIKKETQTPKRAKKMNEDMATEKETKSSSNSEERLTTSEEEKSSLEEEEESCDEECMSFSEYQINDIEKRLQMTVTGVLSGIDQKKSLQEEQWKSEELVNPAGISKTDGLKKPTRPSEMHNALLATDVQLHEKEDRKQELNYCCSDDEQVAVELPECYTIYCKHVVDKNQHRPKKEALCHENALQLTQKKNNFVAELVCNLESGAQRTSTKTTRPENTFIDHNKVSDTVPLTCERSHIDCSSEMPSSSSLAFSYDSQSSSLAQESERKNEVNRVKSIREMFLAKSSTRIQNGQKQLQSPNSDQSDYQFAYTNSGEDWSQTSADTSILGDDSSRLAIAKGFVKRTIEKLYGRGNLNTEPNDMRPQSVTNLKQKVCPGRTNVSSLASFHEARSRVLTDLSYFSATSSMDVANDPAYCITMNEQVEHGDADHTRKGKEKKEKTNQTISLEPQKKTVNDDCPHMSPPSTDSSCKCTYFNLPNASDSELEQVEQKLKTLQKSDVKVSPETLSPKSLTDKKRFLPALSPPVFIKSDNKVYPLTEAATSPVVTQPVNGQSSQIEVIRHSSEPDALEMLFVFCGQHCPIL